MSLMDEFIKGLQRQIAASVAGGARAKAGGVSAGIPSSASAARPSMYGGNAANSMLSPTKGKGTVGDVYGRQPNVTTAAMADIAGRGKATTGTNDFASSASRMSDAAAQSEAAMAASAASPIAKSTNVPNPAGTGQQGIGTAGTPFGDSIMGQSLSTAFDNPEFLIRHFYDQTDRPTHGGSYAETQELAKSMGMLWMLLNGGDASNLTENPYAYVDWSGGFLENAMQPGGAMPTAPQVMQNLLGAGDDPNNVLYQFFANSNLTAGDQVNNVLQAMRSALGPTMPSPILAATLGRAQELGDTYGGHRLSTGAQPGGAGGMTFLDYLSQQGMGGMFGM